MLVSSPEPTTAQLVAVPIWVGVVRLVVVPSPSCPKELYPHAHSVPSMRVATVWSSPVATDVQVSDPIWVGVSRLVVVLSPSCPKPLKPQAHNVPSTRMPSVNPV